MVQAERLNGHSHVCLQSPPHKSLQSAWETCNERIAWRGLFLEDLHAGQRFSSRAITIDEEHIKSFAKQFDPQPFHLDGHAAKATLFGGLVASGWHTAAITMKLLVESGLPLNGGIVGVGGEVSWPRPTRPGDTLTVVSEIEEVIPSRSRPERGMVRVRSETRNQRDETVLLAKLIVPRRVTGDFGPR
jgi:acyl dehydratase